MEEETKQNKPQAIIEIDNSGPLKISGNIMVNDIKRGNELSSREVLLCLMRQIRESTLL